MIKNLLPNLVGIFDTTVIVQTIVDEDPTDEGWNNDTTTAVDSPAYVAGPTSDDAIAGITAYDVVILLPLTLAVDFTKRIVIEPPSFFAGTYEVVQVRTNALHHRVLCRTRAN